ncbi:MAG: porin [Halomonadaceae bacterium]|nr:MAG: porin [Halomonadaceae bacterium]
MEYDFAEEGVSANDVRLRYRLPAGRLIIGQTKVPMGLNELTSSNSMTFIERASNSNVIADSRRLGLSYHLSQNNYTFQTMVYSRAIGDSKQAGDSQIGAAGRFVFNPIMQGTEMLHLGASIAVEDFADQRGASFSDRPESRPAGARLIGTGDLEDATGTFKYGLEAAYKNGPFSMEAEYLSVDVDRADNSDPSFDGYHIQASYVLTGESRSYSGGNFGGIRPSSPGGAWEVAARFSSIDLDDSGVTGGKQENITLGLNYYANANVRFMANLIRADIEGGTAGEDETANIALLRAQYSF